MTLLVGEPGWYVWYVVLWLCLVPGIMVWRWLGTMKPGAGPQGGLVAFAGLFFTIAALTLLGLVLAISYAGRGPSTGAGRYVRVLGVWLLGWSVMVWQIGRQANRASLADATSSQRVRARWLYLGLLVATAACGLGILARLRAP